MKRVKLSVIILLYLSLYSCGDNSPKKRKQIDTSSYVKSVILDTTYLPTGYYFLAEGFDGIKKQMEKTSEIYYLYKTSFASVKNIIKTELVKDKINNQVSTSLCMTFDAKGIKDLAEGTGNPEHPQIAIVIANKLVYVVDNDVQSQIGVMCVTLSGYTEQEILFMRKAIEDKK